MATASLPKKATKAARKAQADGKQQKVVVEKVEFIQLSENGKRLAAEIFAELEKHC